MSERTCEHWEIAFTIVNDVAFVRCESCKKTGHLKMDGREANQFTTNRAKMAINGATQATTESEAGE